MRINEIIKETTSAGAIATVAVPMNGMISRTANTPKKKKKKKSSK